MTRKELVIVVFLSAFLWVVVGGAGYMMWRSVSSFKPPDNYVPSVPQELKDAGVRVGADAAIQKVFFKDERLGMVTDVVFYEPKGIVIAGLNGALVDVKVNKTYLDYSGEKFSAVVVVISDGEASFLGMGYDGRGPGVLASDGKRRWSFAGKRSDMYAFGDMDGDGKKEFLTRHVDGAGFAVYDSAGTKIMEKNDIEIGQADFADTDGDGKDEIIYENFDGELFILDTGGGVKGSIVPEFYFSGFYVSQVPNNRAWKMPLVCYNESPVSVEDGSVEENGAKGGAEAAASRFALVDYMGGTVASFDAPLCDYSDGFLAVPVRFAQNKGDYFAVLAYSFEYDRSVLYLYSPEKELVYMEVLPVLSASMDAYPDGGSEALLIGSGGQVLEYRLKTEAAAASAGPAGQGTQNGK